MYCVIKIAVLVTMYISDVMLFLNLERLAKLVLRYKHTQSALTNRRKNLEKILIQKFADVEVYELKIQW